MYTQKSYDRCLNSGIFWLKDLKAEKSKPNSNSEVHNPHNTLIIEDLFVHLHVVEYNTADQIEFATSFPFEGHIAFE